MRERQLEELALVVHGALAALHGLGILYNLRRRNWWDVCAHIGALGYDLWAADKHMRIMRHGGDET